MLRFNNFIIFKVNVLNKFAARLNSFKIGHQDYWPGKNNINTLDLLGRASKAGINAADLNFSEHFEDINIKEFQNKLKDYNSKIKLINFGAMVMQKLRLETRLFR